MPTNHLIILCTCPDKTAAENIARMLVKKKLVACVNILPGITSVYPWQGKIETAEEHLLVIKTRQDNYATVEQRIHDIHPYELPEIIAVPIAHGLPEYLQWIDSCLC